MVGDTAAERELGSDICVGDIKLFIMLPPSGTAGLWAGDVAIDHPLLTPPADVGMEAGNTDAAWLLDRPDH